MKKILALLIMLFPLCLSAQDSKLGDWLIYIGSMKLDSKWNIHHEVQYRNYDMIGDLEQLLLRTGIGYNFSEKNNNLLLGYGYIHSQNYVNMLDDKVKVNEHRIFQQFVTKQSIGRLKVQHRYRFEQRFVEDQDLKLRFRYFLALKVPFNNADLEDKTWYASAYNEIFINHKQVLFDRNRLYGGIGYKLNSNVKLELGYMNQFLNNQNRDQLNLVALVSF